jgi:hypothetical protein
MAAIAVLAASAFVMRRWPPWLATMAAFSGVLPQRSIEAA